MRAFLAIALLYTSVVFAKGKLQNEDFKTLSELTTAGGTAAQLLNDTKVYVTANGINSQLSSAITNGQLGGSGTGINLLQALNPTFESGISSWTASGGTFTHITSGQLFGLGSGQWTPTAAAQTLQSSLVSFPTGSVGKSCIAVFEYNWGGTLGQITADLVDGSNNVLATMTLNPTTGAGATKSYSPNFDCPVSPTQARIKLTTTAASSALKIDQAFIGLFYNDVQVSQAELYGTAQMGTNTVSTTSATLVDMTGTGVTYSTTGKVSQGLTTRYQIILNNAPPGKYELSWSHRLEVTGQTTSTICRSAIYDGSSFGDVSGVAINRRQAADSDATGDDENEATAVFSYATSGTRTFTLQGNRASGNGTCFSDGAAVIVKYYPLNANQAITLETTGWFLEGTISSTTQNLAIGTGSIPTQSELTDGTLELQLRPGSASGTIACSGTNASTGLTCATGNESVGVQVPLPSAGQYEVCFIGNAEKRITASANATALTTQFNIQRTANGAQTILDDSYATTYHNSKQSLTSGQQTLFVGPVNICAPFSVATAGPATFRLMASQGIAGSSADVAANILYTNRLAAGFVGVRIRKLNEQVPTPIFTDLTNSLKNRVANSDAGQTVLYSATITNNGSTCSGTNVIGGSWFSSLTRNGTGQCTVNYASGFFDGASVPTCFGMIQGGTGGEVRSTSQTAALNTFITGTSAAGAAVDATANFSCYGRK
jgi:hypothetical protein